MLSDVLHDLAENCRARLVDRNSDFPCGPAALAPDEWLAGWQESSDFLPAASAPRSIPAAYRGRIAEVERAAAALAAGTHYPLAVAGGNGWGVAQTGTASGVRCETSDLEVPANAEIVLEGYVELGEMRTEGPFGDHTGFYSLEDEYPVFHLTCITQRRDPIYAATIVGQAPMAVPYTHLTLPTNYPVEI